MEELKKLFEQGGMKYHFFRHGLCIISPVKAVNGSDGLEINFEGGQVFIWTNQQIKKVRRPSNMVMECEYCYQLVNEYRDPIGYVYKVKEGKVND